MIIHVVTSLYLRLFKILADYVECFAEIKFVTLIFLIHIQIWNFFGIFWIMYRICHYFLIHTVIEAKISNRHTIPYLLDKVPL